jgi:hypothetical protein
MRSRLAVFAALALAVAARATAQEASLSELALQWLHGDFRAPLICEIEGAPHRAVRRVRILPARQLTHRPTDRVVFYDLEAPTPTRCHDEKGAAEENVIGAVSLVHESRRDRPDTASHDFADALRRSGGFDFRIADGVLRLGEPGAPLDSLRSVDFAGGTAEAREVRPGSDAWRRLGDFGPRRKLSLTLVARDGTRLAFDLAELEPGR